MADVLVQIAPNVFTRYVDNGDGTWSQAFAQGNLDPTLDRVTTRRDQWQTLGYYGVNAGIGVGTYGWLPIAGLNSSAAAVAAPDTTTFIELPRGILKIRIVPYIVTGNGTTANMLLAWSDDPTNGGYYQFDSIETYGAVTGTLPNQLVPATIAGIERTFATTPAGFRREGAVLMEPKGRWLSIGFKPAGATLNAARAYLSVQ